MSIPNGAINNFFPSETNRLNDLGTVRGRLGLAVDRSLFYFTAGLAFGEVANSVQYNSFKFPTFNIPSYNVELDPVWVGRRLRFGIRHQS